MLNTDNDGGRAAPPRALIYNRVSSDPSGKRVSVESQERENRAFCDREGYVIAAVITDNDRSASRYATKTRDGYEQVKEALAGNVFGRIDVLVCWESSRAQRGLKDYVVVRDLCYELDVRFAYSGRSYDLRDSNDRLATGLHALLDEQESDKIRSRILRSHRDSAATGKPRSFAPFGYTREYDPQSGRLLRQVPDPDTSAVVQGIVARILAGAALYSIARDLNVAGVLTPQQRRDVRKGRDPGDRSRGWSPMQLRTILSNPSLKGVRAHRGVEVGPALWPAIIEPVDWARIQPLINDPRRRTSARGTRPLHLLSGIAECAACGGWLRVYRNRGRLTYACGGLGSTASRGHVSRSLAELDRYVEVFVVALLERPDATGQMESASAGGDEVAQARASIAQLEGELSELRGLAAAGKVSPGGFAEIEVGMLTRLDDLRRQVAPRWVPTVVQDLAGPHAAAGWEAATLEVKRTALRALLRVVVHPGGPGGRGRRGGVNPELVEIRRLV